jgi:hypothetical protein
VSHEIYSDSIILDPCEQVGELEAVCKLADPEGAGVGTVGGVLGDSDRDCSVFSALLAGTELVLKAM